MTEPIKPSEIDAKRLEVIPSEVILAFNNLIAKHWESHQAIFTQAEAISEILSIMNSKGGLIVATTIQDVMTKKYLNIEDIYRKADWIVQYEKPGFNEGGEAKFIFKARTI